MQFETHRSHAGQFHWCLVGDGGAKLAVSATAAPRGTRGSPQPTRVCTPGRSTRPKNADDVGRRPTAALRVAV
jgi:hypothetical protein